MDTIAKPLRSWWNASNDSKPERGEGRLASNEDVIVYPLHMLDQAPVLRSIIITWTLRFDAILDTELLRNSLDHLLTMGDWRKLGGRLRTKNGRLEIHSPTSFSAERAAFAFSHVNVDVCINEHEVGRHLPKKTDSASIQRGPGDFAQFSSSTSAPSTLNDFLRADVPLISLHITSFKDATLVGLSWPHVLMDVMGQQAFLHSWSLVLASHAAEVPPLLGAHEDALLTAAEAEPAHQRQSYEMQSKALGSLGKLSFGLRMGWDMLWEGCETRSIFLPQVTMRRLREQALKDIAHQREDEEVRFLSDGDILTGWMAQIVASSLPSSRPLTILHAMNARFRVKALKQEAGAFVQNMAVPSFTFLSSLEAGKAAGTIALENRCQLTEQAAESQVLAFVRDLRTQPAATRDPSNTLAGEANALLMPFTDWSKADFFNTVDFGAAVIMRSCTETDAAGAGKVTYHHACSMQPSPTMRNVVVIYGKTCDGDFWLNGTFTATTWAKVESAVVDL